MIKQNNALSFRISAGLKNIIGRDLISDKYIAVFEIVKNSYDAGASKVDIIFKTTKNEHNQIIISDDGCGMTYSDILNKWLFVAYSEKKIQNRKESSFRDGIKREVAGAKGVGRFSCDRLGTFLILITKADNEQFANKIEIDWSKFEKNDLEEFVNVHVKHSQIKALPSGYSKGTTLIIDNLREPWDRADLLKLRRSLMKMISPDANKGELPFDIKLIVPSEQKNDNDISLKAGINPDRDIVNGIIHNDIFEKLNIKTTSIELTISEDGQLITSKLTDRGEHIFSLVERNRDYSKLQNISIVIFYLNQSAKVNFTRQMGGVQPKNYGSVFVYKNGFRVNPYGEPGQDIFGIDQRKAQGWKRFLGTREIMGRISIKGNDDQFVETTSRAHGFIQTSAFNMLGKLFIEKVLKVLEKYVVNLINWGEPLKSDLQHTITPNEIGEQIVTQFITNIDTKDIVSVKYNLDILGNKNSQYNQENIVTSLKKLENAAELTKDKGLINLAQTLKEKTESIITHNIHLEKENAENTKKLVKVQKESQARKRQIYFLKGNTNQNVTNLVNGFHSIYTLTDAIMGNIDYLRKIMFSMNFENKDSVFAIVGRIQKANEKARKLADLAIHGNQSLKQNGLHSLYDFIRQYIDAGFVLEGIKYELIKEEYAFDCRFDPSSIGIIIDNIASNSIKASASVLQISLKEVENYVEVTFSDNGFGLPESIEPNSLFEWGYSSNRQDKGYGIGLYHIKQLVDEMNGYVEIDSTYQQGFKIIMRLIK